MEGESPFNDGPLTLSGRLMSWELKLRQGPAGLTPEAAAQALLADGIPRVLDIGCGTGDWCIAMKKQHQDWIVQGVDDVDRWSIARPGLDYK
jgi:tRNA G46 methylase TrmB